MYFFLAVVLMTIMVSSVIVLVVELPMAGIEKIITGVISSKWPIQKRSNDKFGNISIISNEETTFKDNELKRCDSESVNVVTVDNKAYEETENISLTHKF